MKTTRVTGNDLLRFIRNLNVKHNVDNGEAGSVFMEYSRGENSRGKTIAYRASINGTTGSIHLTRIGTAREVIEELRQKDWRRILSVSKATSIAPNRRAAAKDTM